LSSGGGGVKEGRHFNYIMVEFNCQAVARFIIKRINCQLLFLHNTAKGGPLRRPSRDLPLRIHIGIIAHGDLIVNPVVDQGVLKMTDSSTVHPGVCSIDDITTFYSKVI